MRAIAVRVDDVVGVAGFLHPDDRVDVIVTLHPSRPADAEPVSKVILQNVKVLAVGKELEVSERNRTQANPTTVATLLVNPEESEKLALAANEGRIMLTLRSWTDNLAILTGGMNPSELLADSSTKPREVVQVAPQRRTSSHREMPAAPPPPTPPPQPVAEKPKADTVEILRGDNWVQRKFEVKDKP
jgi:pilus assembly protein CpaB